MGKVVIDIAMSLDGYVAGPNDGPEHGLGENGGRRIMGWDPTERLKDISRDNTGAMITGRRTQTEVRDYAGVTHITYRLQ